MSYLTYPFLKKMLEPLNIPLKEIQQLLPGQKQTIYAAAYGLYEKGDYQKASDFFTRLVLSSPFEKSYWKGLASSRQMKQEYREALHAWSIVSLLNPEDPFPHFHAAECLISINDLQESIKALNCAENCLSTSEEHALLKEKITQLKEALKR